MKTGSLIPTFARVTLLLGLVLWFQGYVPGAFAAQNLVYINANITSTGQNAVIALVNDGSGNLTPVPGSPFATGGTGVAGAGDLLDDIQWDSDAELVLNAAGTLLFAVNGHSNDFSAFTLNADGPLTLIAGSPFPSGGTQPASIGYGDNALGNGVSMMMIANKDSDPFQTATAPNYTTFRVSATGVPTLNAGSTLTLPALSSPAHILAPRNGRRNFFGIQFIGSNISSYEFSKSGILTLLSSLNTVKPNIGGALHPRERELYVTMPGADKLAVYSYDAAYNLALVTSQRSPGTAPCWATTNKAGTRLYVGETASGSVTVYDITIFASPVQLQHLVLSGTQPYATHVSLDATEKFLYVVDRQRVLHVLNVAADGTVSEVRTPVDLGLPLGTVPLGVVVLRK